MFQKWNRRMIIMHDMISSENVVMTVHEHCAFKNWKFDSPRRQQMQMCIIYL